MCTDEAEEPSTDEPSESTDPATGGSNESIQPAADTPAPRPTLNRRRFLTAAALGTAAATLLNKGADGLLHIGPLTALANDLSNNPCTAGDVEIVGTGVVQNEPCSCTPGGTFTAHVQFTVRNSTSTGRYCIALHLPSGFGVPSQDVILRDVNGNSTAPGKSGGESFHDTIMFGDITGFPCNTGGTLTCIGQQGVTRGKCAPNTCTTIAWNTSPGAAGCTTADQNPPGGQCRHQGICIQGYGASLDCVGNDCTTLGSCDAACGSTLHLLAKVAGGVSPYFYTLSGSDGTSQRFPASGTTPDTSHCFIVTPTQASTTYTLTVTDSQDCSRTASRTVTSTAIAKPTLTAGTPDCSGTVTYTVTNCDNSLTYTFKEVNCTTGAVIQTLTGNNGGCTLTHTFPQDDADHCVVVTASNGSAACDQTSDKVTVHINAPVTVALAVSGQGNCDGQLTFTATASGGTGTYTFTFKKDGTIVKGPGSSNTLAYGPVLDGACHTISVEVQDSAGCPSTPASASKTVSQCVTTTLDCTPP
jgi:hypothetical protein